MKKRRYIQIMLSEDQYERIRNKAKSKGYKSMSSYLRSQALEKDLVFEKKFEEIYQIVKKKLG